MYSVNFASQLVLLFSLLLKHLQKGPIISCTTPPFGLLSSGGLRSRKLP